MWLWIRECAGRVRLRVGLSERRGARLCVGERGPAGGRALLKPVHGGWAELVQREHLDALETGIVDLVVSRLGLAALSVCALAARGLAERCRRGQRTRRWSARGLQRVEFGCEILQGAEDLLLDLSLLGLFSLQPALLVHHHPQRQAQTPQL